MADQMENKKIESKGSRRGRPTRSQVIAIESKILLTARRMFLEQGYANTTMETVATVAKVAKGTLYARYAEKAELFNAVVHERLEAWAEERPENPSLPSVPLSERLFNFGSGFLERMSNPEIAAFHNLLAAEAERFPELAKTLYDIGQRGAIARLARELERPADGNNWPIGNAHAVSEAFLCALIGWFSAERRVRDLDREECDRFVAGLVAIFVGGRASW